MKPQNIIGSVPSLSGHAIAYRWHSLPRVRRHRASKPQGSSERVLHWRVAMDQLICASLSHAHYWYEVGMLKVPYYYLVPFVWTALPYVCIVRCGRPSALMWLCKHPHHRTSRLAYEGSYCCVYTFGLTVLEAKTGIMCLRAKGVPDSTATFSVEAAGQVYNQTNEFVYLGETSTTTPTCRSRSTGAYATHGAASGSTPSNCTTDRALPSSSKSGC